MADSGGFEKPETRWKSFQNISKTWYISKIKKDLVDNGFFATGKENEAQCYKCAAKYSGWGPGQDIDRFHRENCR